MTTGFHCFNGWWFEVWEAKAGDGLHIAPGFYWWSCFPGCLPDGDAEGPFPSLARAWESATDFADL